MPICYLTHQWNFKKNSDINIFTFIMNWEASQSQTFLWKLYLHLRLISSCKNSCKLKYIVDLTFCKSTLHNNPFRIHLFKILNIHHKWHLIQSNKCPSTLQHCVSTPSFAEKDIHRLFLKGLDPNFACLINCPRDMLY